MGRLRIAARLQLAVAEMAKSEVLIMVAISRSLAPPKYRCILVDKGKEFSTVYKDFAAEMEEEVTKQLLLFQQ